MTISKGSGSMQQHTIPLAHELTIFLICAGLVVPFFKHFKVNPVIGFLVVGMMVGPFGLGQLAQDYSFLSYISITNIHDVSLLAEWGVIFLMFTIGLELSLDRLWRMRRLVFGLGTSQIAVSGLVIGLFAYAWGNSPVASILLGGCLALSSTAVVMQLFAEKGHLNTPYGQTNVSILLMQDLAVVPILFFVTLFGEQQIKGQAHDSSTIWWGLLSTLTFATAVVVVMYLIGRKFLSPLLHMVAKTKSTELFMAATLLIIIVGANITGMAGLSMALGSFLAGLLLAETEFKHTIDVDISPFKGLLLGLFFMSVGMGIDLHVLQDKFFWVIAAVIGLFAIKTSILAGLCHLFGLPKSTSLPTGIMLGQGGEFAFVVVSLALTYQLLPEDTGHYMLLVASFTMLLTPPLAQYADRLWSQLLSQETALENGTPTRSLAELSHDQHVIVAGYGRVARVLCRTLQADDVPFLCIEKDSLKVKQAQSRGMDVFYGDVTRFEILKKAHIKSANTLVVTMDDGLAAEQLVKNVRQEWPSLYIIARARDIAHAQNLMALGANDVILETIEASLQLSAVILKRLGMSEMTVRQRIEQQRQTENNHQINPQQPSSQASDNSA